MSETFITSSLPLAAYLVASGELRMREVRLTDPKRAVVVFDDREGRGPELERKFWAVRSWEHWRITRNSEFCAAQSITKF